MIASRFTPIETTPAGIKARDNDTAQTVVLVDVNHLDPRVVGIFHPALITNFAIVDLLDHPARSLPSRIEIRPSRPKK